MDCMRPHNKKLDDLVARAIQSLAMFGGYCNLCLVLRGVACLIAMNT